MWGFPKFSSGLELERIEVLTISDHFIRNLRCTTERGTAICGVTILDRRWLIACDTTEMILHTTAQIYRPWNRAGSRLCICGINYGDYFPARGAPRSGSYLCLWKRVYTMPWYKVASLRIKYPAWPDCGHIIKSPLATILTDKRDFTMVISAARLNCDRSTKYIIDTSPTGFVASTHCYLVSSFRLRKPQAAAETMTLPCVFDPWIKLLISTGFFSLSHISCSLRRNANSHYRKFAYYMLPNGIRTYPELNNSSGMKAMVFCIDINKIVPSTSPLSRR